MKFLINKELKKLFTNLVRSFVSLLIIFSSTGYIISFAGAAPEPGWVWPSGYKYYTTDSHNLFDDPDYFKWEPIVGGIMGSPIPDLYANFPVSQENWNDTYPACRSVVEDSRTTGGNCSATGMVTFSYTCYGQVPYQMNVDTQSSQLWGGDTTWGALPMLFSFFPPTFGDCYEDGTCMMFNTYVVDTKAQKEAKIGLYQGFGKKLMVEGPGDVYFFDMVRSMTVPVVNQYYPFHNPYVVGEVAPSASNCDPGLYDSQLVGIPTSVSAKAETVRADVEAHFEENMDAYATAAEATDVPCEILAGIHYNEGGMNPTQSLIDGGALRGTLAQDATIAAGLLRDIISNYGLPVTYEGYVAALTLYNGPGNLNCNQDYLNCWNGSNDPPLSASCSPGYVPTQWRCLLNQCPPQFPYDDSPYALAWLDARHDNMDIIYLHDGNGTCSAFINGTTGSPVPIQHPGAIPVAIMVHSVL